MKRAMITVAVLGMALGLTACKSSTDPSVKTNYHAQWTNVEADVKTTTAAAEAVLNEASLKGVTSSATGVDGMASGKQADGTKVNVAMKKKSDTTTEVSVTVGTMGDPTLGADLARKIKMKAEGK